MWRVVHRFYVLFALATLLAGGSAAAADIGGHSFKVTLVSEMEMDIGGQEEKIDADTDLRYAWNQDGDERTLSFTSVRVKANSNGKEMLASYMSREKLATRKDGAVEVVPFEKAPIELKKVLQDSFGVPLCILTVDKTGTTIKQEVVAGAGAKNLIDQGTIANARLFHPPFMPAKTEWLADTEISMGNGGYARGKLTYKNAASANGLETVKVSGTLTSEHFAAPGSPLVIKNAEYVVNGVQDYDPTKREWVSGKLNIDVSFELVAENNPIGTAKGQIIATLAYLPAK